MKTKLILFAFIGLLVVQGCANLPKEGKVGLKDALNGKFLIGAAVNIRQSSGEDTIGVKVIKQHFNSIVAENCMKSMYLQPAEGKFFFDDADRFVDFGIKNNLHIVGHTLIWHSQAPKWFFVNEKGDFVSREVMIERMKNHIQTVVSRYKGKVKGWDVVNEAINDDGTWRQSPFYKIIGKEYIKLAFQFAHEADPNAELYYNDYSMAKQERRDSVVKLVNELKKQGIRVDGIGMQGHMTMDYPTVEEYEKSILAFASTGAKVMITEMDISVIPFPQGNMSADVALKYKYDPVMNPYPNELPDSVANALQARYASFFRLFLKHSDKISRVTLWGISDANTWRNNWPIPGRKDYPLLFDRNYNPKPIVDEVIKMARAEK